jgi:O-antigen/teichoic acid export membrane protein
VIRGAVLPVVTRAVPLALLPLALGADAVAMGHVLAYGLGLALAWRLLGRRMKEVEAKTDEPFAWPSREVMGFSLPAGLADLLATIMVRVDVWMLAWLLDASAVGIYGVILSLVASVRTVRRAFDPVVVPIMSEATALGQTDRIRAAFSQATFLVGCLTGPILAVIWGFGRELLGLYGSTFEQGAWAILILSAGSLIHSVLGLANTVLQGAGRGGLMLLTTVVLITLNTAMNYVFIPQWGITGAAIATATALAGVSVLEYILARRVIGQSLVNWSALEPLAAAAGASALAAPVYVMLGGQVSDLGARAGAFAVMIIAYGLWFWRRGLPAFQVSGAPVAAGPSSDAGR